MNPIFLFPTELEARAFCDLCPEAEVVISGVGMAETAATLARISVSQSLHGRVVILAGIAGCYEQRCEVGEVVEVISEVVSELPERFCKEYHVEMFTNLRGVSSNTVSRCNAESCGADIENMEGAALFAIAEALGFRAVEIRAVSNVVGDDFAKWNIELATHNLAKMLKNYAE
jgi:nucleoside phosphorylase